MRYTEQQKQQAIHLYLQVGAAQTAKQTGITSRTIRRWAHTAGVSAARDENLHQASKRLAAQREAQREELRTLLLSKALDLINRMDEQHKDYRGKDVTPVYWEKATSGDAKNYAVAAAVMIDKFRLEMGESTQRISTITEDVLDAEILRLQEQLADND